MKAVVQFQGFTEDLRNPTGSEDLYWEVIKPFANQRVTTFHPQQWSSDLKALTGLIARRGIREVVVIGYSWGGGYAAIKFAEMLRKQGIRVPLMLLCDPVYRPLWLPAWTKANPFAVRAFSKRVKIKIPDNVDSVRWVRQRMDWPAGHDLKAKSSRVVKEPRVLSCGHTAIDSHPAWFSLVQDGLDSVLKK